MENKALNNQFIKIVIPIAAQCWGNGQKNKVEDVLCIALKYSGLISIVFWAASLWCPGKLMGIKN